MRELIKVKEDLNEIRYYYSLKELFDIVATNLSVFSFTESVSGVTICNLLLKD